MYGFPSLLRNMASSSCTRFNCRNKRMRFQGFTVYSITSTQNKNTNHIMSYHKKPCVCESYFLLCTDCLPLCTHNTLFNYTLTRFVVTFSCPRFFIYRVTTTLHKYIYVYCISFFTLCSIIRLSRLLRLSLPVLDQSRSLDRYFKIFTKNIQMESF